MAGNPARGPPWGSGLWCKGTHMRTTAILGIILMGVGIVCLAYFASPMRLMFQSPMGLPTINLVPPILGALALICGIVLSFGIRPRADKDRKDP